MSGSNLLHLDLQESRTSFQPGETLTGEAAWQVSQIKSAQIRLFWYTSGKGTRDVQLIAAVGISNPQPTGRSGFSFQLPAEPYSFSGKLVSLIWAVELVIKPGNLSTRAEVVVAPDGQEILLGMVPNNL